MKLAAPAFAIACAAALLLAADRPAEACSCAPPPPPCQAYARATAVFVGKATSVTTGQDFATTTTFTIEELFKGPFTKGTVSLIGGGMCSAMFTSGQKYFVYAYEADGYWHAGLCGRTRPLDRAAEDLAHARNLPQRQHAELIGTVRIADEQDQMTPRAGATVTVQGTSYSTTTDASGNYTLQVPPGKHVLEVVDPGTLMHRGPRTVEVSDPTGCASENILLRFDGRIRGRVIDHTGQPAASVTLWTLDASARDSRLFLSGASATTDANGEYEFHGVQAGKQLVAVNPPDYGGPDPRSPIPTTYYPGVASAAAAKRIAMPRSGLVENINFALPKPLPIYTVSGVVKQKGKQGQPVSGARVWLGTELPSRDRRLTNVDTDTLGHFAFREIRGAKIMLQVCPPGGGPNDSTCRTIWHTLTRDWTIDLDDPTASPGAATPTGPTAPP
jgi:hypothetical protein